MERCLPVDKSWESQEVLYWVPKFLVGNPFSPHSKERPVPAAPTWLYWFDESHFDFGLEGKMRIESTFLSGFPWPGILQTHSR